MNFVLLIIMLFLTSCAAPIKSVMFYKNPNSNLYKGRKVILAEAIAKTESDHVLHSIFRKMGYKVITEESTQAINSADMRLHNVNFPFSSGVNGGCFYINNKLRREKNKNIFGLNVPKISYRFTLSHIKTGEEIYSELSYGECPLEIFERLQKNL